MKSTGKEEEEGYSDFQNKYYNAKEGFRSSEKMWKSNYKGQKSQPHTYDKVKKWVNTQETAQIYKPAPKPKAFSSITADFPRDKYQMDIIIYKEYKGLDQFKHILVVIDVFSRYVAARALKSRKMPYVAAAFNDIISDSYKTDPTKMPLPINLNCDNEFNNKTWHQHVKGDSKIRYHYSEPYETHHNAIVERVNRTLRTLLGRWRNANRSIDARWAKVLQDLIYNYNHTFHNTINTTPSDAWLHISQPNQLIKFVPKTLAVKDVVRVLRTGKRKRDRSKWPKEDKGKFSLDTFEIIQRSRDGKGELYQLKSRNDDEVKKGWYREYELSKITEGKGHGIPDMPLHPTQEEKAEEQRHRETDPYLEKGEQVQQNMRDKGKEKEYPKVKEGILPDTGIIPSHMQDILMPDTDKPYNTRQQRSYLRKEKELKDLVTPAQVREAARVQRQRKNAQQLWQEESDRQRKELEAKREAEIKARQNKPLIIVPSNVPPQTRRFAKRKRKK